MADTISRTESWEFDFHVQRKNASTGQLTPIDQSSVVTAWLSATPKGDPLQDDGVITLARRQRTLRDDARTSWFGVLDADTAGIVLAGVSNGGTVYEVCDVDGERKAGKALTVQP